MVVRMRSRVVVPLASLLLASMLFSVAINVLNSKDSVDLVYDRGFFPPDCIYVSLDGTFMERMSQTAAANALSRVGLNICAIMWCNNKTYDK